ncbi:ATP-dependent DNA helicase PIF1, partial [Brachionus plicatilis]
EEEVEITTQSDQVLRSPKEVPIKYQIHTHRGNCKMENKEFGYIYCKYGYPMPILDETIILKPIDAKSDGYENAFRNYMKIRKKLEEADSLFRNKKEETTLAVILTQLNISYVDYKDALASSITRIGVFLKRNSKELMINPYNKEL